ncbi:MAG: archaemetzincin family Zn-dependent metalloprotease [Gemmatimonadetes bacterium]|nr:archaemetzincin family Zn-dependent metalloprotease [Gemmatimonadota bacterium]MBI2401713.1 archaemetzincin family Zn-dependent metalloprotease [Gemmatimonadota bacterium]
MGPPVFVAFLNGYTPPWADQVIERLAATLPYPIRRVDLRFDLRPYYAPERRQHHATLLLATLLRHLPEPGGKIVGITCEDLFIPVLTFVFGQSQLDGPAAVVSTYRLHNESYGLPADEELLRARTVKEVVHELGHAFGLVHCRDQRCVMRASTYVEEVDLKDAGFCDTCRTMIAARTA